MSPTATLAAKANTLVQVIRFSRPTSAPAQAPASLRLVAKPESQIAELRGDFRTHQCVELKELLPAELIAEVSTELQHERFHPEGHHVGSGVTIAMDARPNARLLFLMNDPDLFRALERITECGQIGSFVGRVYRIEGGTDQSLDWHNDLGDDQRRLALSVNLSEDAYGGGVLQLRDTRNGRLLREAKPRAPGDAILFRIADHLEHRVTAVEGGGARTAYAGWFRAGASIFDPQS